MTTLLRRDQIKEIIFLSGAVYYYYIVKYLVVLFLNRHFQKVLLLLPNSCKVAVSDKKGAFTCFRKRENFIRGSLYFQNLAIVIIYAATTLPGS